MGKFVDLTGMKFGRWTVIERAMDKKYSIPYWVCQCECGTIKSVCGKSLKNGTSTNCGCSRGDDLTGMKFGRLTVIERAKKPEHVKSRATYWLCKCECGNEVIVRGNGLKRDIHSCGCLHRDRMKELWEHENFRQMHSEKSSERLKQQWKDEEMKLRFGYKGGISHISNYLRTIQILIQWRKDTYTRENYTCQLTGKHVHGGNSDVHHLYGFNMIVKEAHDLHNIEIKPQVKDYTDEELKLLEDYVTSYHTDTTNAVLLSEEVHILFHQEYGYKNNTPEQFEEFRQRYLNGEFDKELNPTNNKVA